MAVRKTSRAALFILAAAIATGGICGPGASQSLAAEPQQIQFQLTRATVKGKADQVRVTGLPSDEISRFTSLKNAERKTVFPVSVAKANATSSPMLGNYRVESSIVVFEPRFPFREGVTYQVKWNTSDGSVSSKSFAIELTDQTPPRVTEIYPTGNVLPENQLKFYIHFSKAMQQGEAYRHIKLVDKSTGKTVETPFLELGEELWDPAGKRFTLYFDPGRIKRGLQPRDLFGPTLEAGKEYSLVVSAEWKDASAGKGLQKTFRKTFKATEPDTTTPDHKRWKITAPKAGTKEALKIVLDEPLDHAMLVRVIQPETPDGKPVTGEPTIEKGETLWVFKPDQPWSAGIHTLKIDTALEDRAGNSIGRPFEVDMIREATKQVIQDTVTRRFRIK